LIRVLKNQPRHTEIELSWVGDYNQKMINVYYKMGGSLAKRHITYMYLLNAEITFKRFDNNFEGKMYL
jgi:hypothetical protein